jgi:hypothetical protein
MSSVNLTLPDALREQAQARAARDNISFDDFVALAVSKMLSAIKDADYLHERARRGNAESFRRVLSKVPDVEPDEHDRM